MRRLVSTLRKYKVFGQACCPVSLVPSSKLTVRAMVTDSLLCCLRGQLMWCSKCAMTASTNRRAPLSKLYLWSDIFQDRHRCFSRTMSIHCVRQAGVPVTVCITRLYMEKVARDNALDIMCEKSKHTEGILHLQRAGPQAQPPLPPPPLCAKEKRVSGRRERGSTKHP